MRRLGLVLVLLVVLVVVADRAGAFATPQRAAAAAINISRAVAHLHGVDVPFTDVVHQNIHRIVVDRATAEVDLNYADVNTLLSDKHLRLSEGAGGRVHVTASAGPVQVDDDFPLTVQGSDVDIALPAGISVQIPLPRMPFGISLLSARADGNGIVVRCATSGFVIRPR